MPRAPSLSPQRCLELCDELVAGALEPGGTVPHSESLWEGYRLLTVDGTPWSRDRTPVFIAQLPGPARRRLQVALARLRIAIAAELSTHLPVAMVVQLYQEKESRAADLLWRRIPECSLIVGDEAFGTAPNVYDAARPMCHRNIHLLTSVANAVKSQPIERLPDGSAWVEILIRDVSPALEPLRVREIRATGRAANGRRFQLRLWTTLSDPHRFSAEVLARNFVERWGPMLGSRELKLDAKAMPPRSSHTMESSLQELSATVLSAAVLARARSDALLKGERAPSWLSYPQVLHATEKLWAICELLGDSLTDSQRRRMMERYEEAVRRAMGRPERGTPIAPSKSGLPFPPSRRSADGRLRRTSAQVVVQKL